MDNEIITSPKEINNSVLLDEEGNFRKDVKKLIHYYKLNPYTWLFI